MNINIHKKKSSEASFKVVLCEADELWSFVGSRYDKSNWVYVWLVIDVKTRQILGMHCGGRKKEDALKLWDSLPEVCTQSDPCEIIF